MTSRQQGSQPASDHESEGSEPVRQTEASSAKTNHSDGEVTAPRVGYGRPPKHAQFPKGRSGNPNGRPKGSKNFGLVIENELNTKIPINENGKRKSITKREAVAKQLVNKAASGDAKAIPILLNEARAREKAGIGLGPDTSPRVEDQQVMSGILERIRRGLDGSIPPASWIHSLQDGTYESIEQLAEASSLHSKVVRQALRLAFLSPDFTSAVLEGRQPKGLSLALIPKLLPLSWTEHRHLLDGFSGDRHD
jgi:hypothetical protein